MSDADTRRALTAWALVVWALKDCQAARIIESATKILPIHYIPSSSADGVAAIARQQALGATVDVSAPMTAAHLNDDAFEVYMAMRRELAPEQFHLVRETATRGLVPDWRPDLADLEIRPVLVERKKKLIIKVIRNLKYCGDFCPIVYVDRSAEVLAFRLHYSYWFAGLEILCGYFEDHPEALKRHKVAGIGVARAPWKAADARA